MRSFLFSLLFLSVFISANAQSNIIFYVAETYHAHLKRNLTETILEAGDELFPSDSILVSEDGFTGLFHGKTYSTIDLDQGRYSVSDLIQKYGLNKLPSRPAASNVPKIIYTPEPTDFSYCLNDVERCRCLGNGFGINAASNKHYIYQDSLAFLLTMPYNYKETYTLLQQNMFDDILSEHVFTKQEYFIYINPSSLELAYDHAIIFRIKNHEGESTDGLILLQTEKKKRDSIQKFLQYLSLGKHIGGRTCYLMKALNYEEYQCSFNALYYYRRYLHLSNYHDAAVEVCSKFMERHCMLSDEYYQNLQNRR